MRAPRPPSTEELVALATAQGRYDEGEGFVFDPQQHQLPQWAVVFDNYITDTPGYSGPVAVIVWGGGPEMVTSYVRRQGQWQVAAECVA